MHPKIDFISGIVLMVFSVAAHRMADRLPPVPKGLGPGDYPKVIVTILFILGLILSGNAYYTARKKSWEGKKSYAKEEFKQVFLLVLCIAVYIKLVGYMGYLYLTPFFVFAMMYLYGLRTWVKMGVISLVTGVFTYVLFNNYLYVLLPRFNLF